MSNVLIFVEHSQGQLKKTSLPGIRFGQQMAEKTGGQLHLLFIGEGSQAAAQAAANLGASQIWVVEQADLHVYLAEPYTTALAAAAKAAAATTVAAAATSTSKDMLPRLAARLGAGMASDVLSVESADTFTRPMWAGNVVATVQIATANRVCSVRGTAFAEPQVSTTAAKLVPLTVDLGSQPGHTKRLSHREVKSERPDVATASRIVSGGRGVKDPTGFKVVEQLADALHAGVGASRAVCDAGWVPNDLQIGQTGKVVAPDLYVALGISGAIQHLAGMKGSKVIVAVNKDPEAPIFQVADYGLVADLFVAVPEIIRALKT